MAGRSLLDDTAALRGLLSLLPGRDSAAGREAASLSLVVNLRLAAPRSVAQALASVAAMESYSRSLQRYPLVKQAFWEQVLGSDLMVGATKPNKQQLQPRHEQFPRLVLDFSRCKLTAELLETLAQFFAGSGETQQWQPTLQSQFSGVKVEDGEVATARVVPVALRFIRSRLTADLIRKLEVVVTAERKEVADGEKGATPVRYCVTSLDLSENAMKAEELTALAELLDGCSRRRMGRWDLPLEELVLENAVNRTLTTENWAAFRALVIAAFGVAGGNRNSLKRLSLANNSLSYHHVACICSALRCEDTPIEELSLARTFSLVDPGERSMCWQWLAIGLRPAVPRDGRSGLRRLDLSGNPLFPLESEAWLDCLRDSQMAVLRWLEDAVPQGRSSRNAAAIRCLLSSSTELYSSPSEASPRLHIIEKEVQDANVRAESKEWEVLASLGSWLCVVVPSFGIAWTQAKHAMSWEHTEDGVASGSAVLSELIMNDMAASLTTTEALESFVGGFRGQLRSLELRRNALSAMDLDAILAGCRQLHTLDVEGCRILQLQLLVDALSGDLGQHLRILNLNANLVGADSMNVLAAALRGIVHDQVPVLQELRVAHNEIGANGVRHLHAALEMNKRLLLLELDLPNEGADAPRRPDDDEYIQLYRTRCMRLDVSFQNELLGVAPVPVDRKLTFLLVLNACDVVLDPGICSAIFDFAADEKRRRILWNSAR
ncbi:ABC transporter G family member 31 [Phytophthora cinnamomi]|uniref:ABC transporter G family member 31 n=1 Tax=Phytophthora cinnamomi TaxID=4785 RepID=UPI00355A21C9|nr:ABC transporter G family member 31 [Phytophthora cinnamomi]